MKYKYLLFPILLASFTVNAQKKAQAVFVRDSILQLSEVVISASRIPENVLKSPISIALLDNRSIQNSAAPSFYDASKILRAFNY